MSCCSPSPWVSPRPDAPDWTYDGARSGVVRVLGETDDAVEIELGWQPSDASMHCVRHSFSDLGLRLFIDVDPERLRVDKVYVPARADSVPVALEQDVAGVVTYGDHDFCFWRQSLYASAPGDPPRALVGAECIQVAGVVWLNPEGTGCDRSSGGGGLTVRTKMAARARRP